MSRGGERRSFKSETLALPGKIDIVRGGKSFWNIRKVCLPGEAMRTVAAALIEKDGCLLVGQRRRNDRFGLRWEFPGGKVRSEETPEQGLARELREELGVESVIGPEVYRTRHRYGEFSQELLLIFFAAHLRSEPANLAFEQVCWIERARLPQVDFLPADRELVSRLAAGELAIS